MKKIFAVMVLAVAIVFVGNNQANAEMVHVMDRGSTSYYIETDSIKFTDKGFWVESYNGNGEYNGFHTFTQMKNGDYIWIYVFCYPNRRSTDRTQGGLASVEPFGKAVLETVSQYYEL